MCEVQSGTDGHGLAAVLARAVRHGGADLRRLLVGEAGEAEAEAEAEAMTMAAAMLRKMTIVTPTMKSMTTARMMPS